MSPKQRFLTVDALIALIGASAAYIGLIGVLTYPLGVLMLYEQLLTGGFISDVGDAWYAAWLAPATTIVPNILLVFVLALILTAGLSANAIYFLFQRFDQVGEVDMRELARLFHRLESPTSSEEAKGVESDEDEPDEDEPDEDEPDKNEDDVEIQAKIESKFENLLGKLADGYNVIKHPTYYLVPLIFLPLLAVSGTALAIGISRWEGILIWAVLAIMFVLATWGMFTFTGLSILWPWIGRLMEEPRWFGKLLLWISVVLVYIAATGAAMLIVSYRDPDLQLVQFKQEEDVEYEEYVLLAYSNDYWHLLNCDGQLSAVHKDDTGGRVYISTPSYLCGKGRTPGTTQIIEYVASKVPATVALLPRAPVPPAGYSHLSARSSQ